MKKLYLYNPATDNFERFYPSIKDRLKSIGLVLVVSAILALGFYFLYFYAFETPTVENLTAENLQLKQQLNQLDKRIDNSMRVMSEIQNRDTNFYRVMLQMDPLVSQHLNSEILPVGNPEYSKVKDNLLVERLTNRVDTLDYLMLHQMISFNNIRDIALNHQEKLDHVPSVLPINIKDYTTSSGFGIRIDPIYSTHKFHAGLDIAAKMGTQVFATADGKVEYASAKTGYGNCIDIDHGYNYVTRYAHLSQILVKPGAEVKRGELIGLVGSTGKSTGPHLHYEVRYKDIPQNPVNFYFMDLSPEEYAEMIEIAENAGHVMD